jgi:hypothetical protein
MNDVSTPEPAAPSIAEPYDRPAPSPPESRAAARHWLRWSAGAGAAVLVFAAAAVGIARFTKAPAIPADTNSIIDEWRATMQRIGLDPVYPPQEDVFVGDVYVVVTWDNDMPQKSPLVGKSVNVARIDMNKALQQAYRSGYTFPDSTARPQAEGAPWLQQAAPGSIFESGAERKNLPLVLLPGFTIARARQASAGGGWLTSAFSALGAVEGEGQSTVELKIPYAETYGVPSLVASQYLDDFCKDPASRGVCTHQGARNELLSNVGSEVTDRVKCPGPAATAPCLEEEKRPYRLDVEIVLINRVYMTRSIETVTRSSSNFGAQAKATVKIAEELRQMQAAAPAAPAANASPVEIDATRRALEDQKARLEALTAQLSAAPGASAGMRSGDASSISITQNLQRPVVIGYRAVKRAPE